MNLVQSLLGAATKPERPLHAGEAMSLWAMMVALQDGRAMILNFVNHALDSELKSFMEQYVSDFEEQWIKRTKQFMLERGIPMPAAQPDRPKADPSSIPVAARFTDAEIAVFMAAKVRSGLQVIQHATLECLHYGLGAMLLEFQAATLRQAVVLRELMERRGWLQVPPQWQPDTGSG